MATSGVDSTPESGRKLRSEAALSVGDMRAARKRKEQSRGGCLQPFLRLPVAGVCVTAAGGRTRAYERSLKC